jgi:intein/homing endonuclease
MGRAGYYKCDACRGEGKLEVRSGNDTDWESSTSRIEDCDKCDGSGRIYYHENGETYRERILRQNREEKENLRYYHRPCFPYRTLIDTPYGNAKIGDLKKGQLVLSYDAGELVPRVITRKRVRGIAQVLRVEFDDGKMLFTTAHHTFLTEGGWKKLADIHLGEKLVKADDSTSTVARFTKLDPEPVFNIYTEGEHNFIADGCVAHNFTEFRTMRTLLHRLFLDPKHKNRMVFG